LRSESSFAFASASPVQFLESAVGGKDDLLESLLGALHRRPSNGVQARDSPEMMFELMMLLNYTRSHLLWWF
jgi:hypothetical protein